MKKYLLLSLLIFSYYFLNYLIFKFSISNSIINKTIIGDILIYIPTIIYITVLLIYYRFSKYDIIELPFNWIYLLISIILTYLFSFIFDPYYRLSDFETLDIIKFNFSTFKDLVALYIVMCIFGSLFEELFFRGLLLNMFKDGNIVLGMLIISIFYAISHFYFFDREIKIDFVRFVNLFFLGVLFSILTIKYGILFSIISHIFYNTIIFFNDNNIIDLFVLDYVGKSYFYYLYIPFTLLFFILIVLVGFKNEKLLT